MWHLRQRILLSYLPLLFTTLRQNGLSLIESFKGFNAKNNFGPNLECDVTFFEQQQKANMETNAVDDTGGNNIINRFRLALKKFTLPIVNHPMFDRFILMVILLNSAFLAMADYSFVDDTNNLSERGSIRNQIIIESEIYFTSIFICEFALKISALGVCGKHSYFADSWNWLDFFVVVSSLVSLAPGVANVNFLRTFRVLRPLKSLRSLPGVADIVVVKIRNSNNNNFKHYDFRCS